MIKVGDTFEVVRVLSSIGYEDSFKDGGTSIRREGFKSVILNGEPYKGDIFRKRELCEQNALYLQEYEVKPIGRLIITKVK